MMAAASTGAVLAQYLLNPEPRPPRSGPAPMSFIAASARRSFDVLLVALIFTILT